MLQQGAIARRAEKQRDSLASAQREQLERLAAAQGERDRIRDQKFNDAMSLVNRGQFAMWIQTPDGGRFEAWADHALHASRALDDRQDAWEFAWSEVAVEAQRDAESRWNADLEQYVSDRYTPPIPSASNPHAKKFVTGMIASLAVMIAAFMGLAVLVTLIPSSEGHLIAQGIYFMLTTIMVGGFAAFVFFLVQAMNLRSKLKANVPPTREQLVNEFHRAHPIAAVSFTPPPWHRALSADEGRALSVRIASTAEEAHELFPRKDQLEPLRRVYATRPSSPSDTAMPEGALRLLQGFRVEDARMLAEIEAAGMN